MITRIEATHYRCLDKMGIDLQPFCVLVGANGAGKTTLLDLPGLLGDCLRLQNIAQAFITRGNNRPPRSTALNELIFCSQGDYFIVAIEASLPEYVIQALLPSQSSLVKSNPTRWLRYARYEIRFEIFNERQLIVGNEYLFLFANSTVPQRNTIRLHGEFSLHRDWRFILKRDHSGDTKLRKETQKSAKSRSIKIDASMMALPRVKFESLHDFPAASWLHRLLVEQNIFYHPNLELLQVASPPGLPETLMPDAANLPWLAMKLQKDKERYSLWVDHVRTALPQISDIKVQEREDHHAYFIITYNGGYHVSSSGLSEGTLRVLSLTILPYLDNLPSLIITEEPENSLHPRAIEAVLQSLSSVYDSQVLISSHSPVVLAHTRLNQILCARLESNGAVTVIRGEQHHRLKEWKGQIDLGALFAAGVLG